ncbi:hypothetical protein D0X99_15050 [Algoriphagus lacus]|uniref:DoxX family membrane protein n=1 Tax=Algoriphagus lacus TaxID=2056311 RepID=A0A418PPV7_9BACT|nr:hypothetical protein [Algoriphagus lacus]RIW14117.1 hypothetical protein D0X99_15050 [Algoriphagus lacus]
MKNFFIQSISAFLGFTFWGAGMVKLYEGHHFIGWIGPQWLVEKLAEYDLGLYAEFIAIAQITIGFMLMTSRFKLLGGIMLVPMILNILMVTISQNWQGTPYVLAVLLAMNGFLLWQFRDYFSPLVNESFPKTSNRTKVKRTWTGHGVWLVGLSLNLLSISVSYEQLTLAFVLAGIGVVLGILSFRVDRYYLSQATFSNQL